MSLNTEAGQLKINRPMSVFLNRLGRIYIVCVCKYYIYQRTSANVTVERCGRQTKRSNESDLCVLFSFSLLPGFAGSGPAPKYAFHIHIVFQNCRGNDGWGGHLTWLRVADENQYVKMKCIHDIILYVCTCMGVPDKTIRDKIAVTK